MNDQSAIAIEFAAGIEMRLRSMKSTGETSAADMAPATTSPQSIADSSTETRSYIETLLRDAGELAAVSGRFNPRKLLDASIAEETRQIVLSRLAQSCAIEPSKGGVQWLLLKNPRTLILTDMINDGRLLQRLESPLPPTDRFGVMLRDLLERGANINLADLNRQDLLEFASAIEATSEVSIQRPDEAELRKLIKRTEFLARYDILFEKGFIGRETELANLRRFVINGDDSKGAIRSRWSGLILTGLGGAGKSTLLAKLARDIFADRVGTVVILDFDRPGVDARDLYWLQAEMSRQIGYQYPEIDEMLRQIRQDVRLQKAEVDPQFIQSSSDAVSQEREHRRLVSGIREALTSINAETRPLLLVLDTFEEVSQRDLVGKLIEWLYEIASHLMPVPLRVIFSGRIYEQDRDALTNFGLTSSLEVNELEPEMAEKLLQSLGISAKAASRLANSDVLPRRPLELKLLAKLVDSDDEKAVEELEDEIRRGGDAARELFAGIVYRRVLTRIKNETAQSLAYPGLVLRYLTTELIQQVLVPALKLPPIDDHDAALALDSLASYGWLAYRGGNGEVYHRKDLRRSMLKAMIGQERENARRINTAAVSYFGAKSTEKEWAEGIYNRLMLAREASDGEPFELAELKRANEYIGVDAVDLPPAARAFFKFAVEGEVSVSDVQLIPQRYRKTAYERTGQRLVKNREFGKASELYLLYKSERNESQPERSISNSWEIETLFATASWEEIEDRYEVFPKKASSVNLQQLTNILFPTEIVQPGLIPVDQVEEALIGCAKADESALKGITTDKREVTFQRLAIGLVLLNNRSPLRKTARKAIGAIIKRIRQSKRPAISPTLERKLLLLDFLSQQSPLPEARLSPVTLRLSRDWLKSLLGRVTDTSLVRLILQVEAILFESGRGETRTVRQTLGEIDGLTKKPEWRRGLQVSVKWTSEKPGSLLQLLRGPDPEFRDPCRFALLDAFPNQASIQDLGKLFASVTELELTDLSPTGFTEAIASSPEHALESYVELVDRSWELGKLLDLAKSARPEALKLGRVLDAYKRWDKAVQTTILKAFKRS